MCCKIDKYILRQITSKLKEFVKTNLLAPDPHLQSEKADQKPPENWQVVTTKDVIGELRVES